MPRAVKFDQYGGPGVLYIADVPVPEPAEGQLLIRVKAAGINPFDSKVREGAMEGMIKVTFPAPQGNDVAGVIEAVGDGVPAAFKVGDEVLGATAARGSQGDYALLPAKRAVHKPASLSWEAAGGIFTVATTAYAMVASVGAGAGDVVLVAGASGGVGSLVCQLAVAAGATVIGIASASNHDWLAAHGVIAVTYGDGIAARVRAAAPQGAVDAVLDAVGGGYVRLGIELGVTPSRIDTIADHPAASANPGVKTDGGMAAPLPHALQQITDQIATGAIELRVDRVFPIGQVAAAYELLEHGHPQGKIVLTL